MKSSTYRHERNDKLNNQIFIAQHIESWLILENNYTISSLGIHLKKPMRFQNSKFTKISMLLLRFIDHCIDNWFYAF